MTDRRFDPFVDPYDWIPSREPPVTDEIELREEYETALGLYEEYEMGGGWILSIPWGWPGE